MLNGIHLLRAGLVSLLLLVASSALAAADRCVICGRELADKSYIVTDKVTEEKKHICDICVKLPHDCFLCGLPVKDGYISLPDGRFLCSRDARTAVLDEAAAATLIAQVKDRLDRQFSRFLNFPDTNVDMEVVDRVDLHELFKFPGNDYACPNVLGYIRPETNHHEVRYKMSLLSGLPRAQLKAVIAHEYSHAWVFANVPPARRKTLGHDAHEGFCELVAYLLMDAEHETEQKQMILRNHYTRGQIDLFIEAERRYGLNDIMDWMKYGADSLLSGNDLSQVRDVKLPEDWRCVRRFTLTAADSLTAPTPPKLKLNGILWSETRPLALINNHSVVPGDELRLQIGSTNESIRCISIGKDSVKILFPASGRQQELSLEHR